jgi:hypothetical protein
MANEPWKKYAPITGAEDVPSRKSPWEKYDPQPEAKRSALSGTIFSSTNNPKPADMGGDPVTGVLRSATRGVLGEGVPALVNAPSAIVNLAGKADKYIDPYMPEVLQTKNIDKAIDTYLPSWLSFLKSSQEMPDLYTPTKNAMAKLTMGESEYEPKNLVEKGVARVSSFIPAAATAALTGGATLPEALIYGATVPAVAGMVAEPAGTALATKLSLENPEAWGRGARIAAEIASPMGVSRLGRIGAKPLPGAADRLKDLTELENLGIPVTAAPFHPAGATRDAAYAREAANTRLATIHAKQDEFFTRHMLENVGVDASTAAKHGFGDVLTPDNMKKTFSAETTDVGNKIGDVYKSVPIIGSNNDVVRLGEIRNNFAISEPKYYRGFGEDLHLVRKELNDIISNPNAGAVQISDARQAVKELDGILAKHVTPDVAAGLQNLNEKYTKMKIIERSFGDDGLVNPKNMTATIASVTANPASMLRISELARNYLIKNGIRPTAGSLNKVISWLVTTSGGAIGTALSTAAMGYGIKPAIIGLISAGGTKAAQVALEVAKNSKSGTQLGQTISRRQGIYGDVPVAPITAPAAVTETGSYIEKPAPYKRGGRVSSSHDMAADQLVRAAERAKKGWSEETEPLLNQSDDAIAHALEVANRSI